VLFMLLFAAVEAPHEHPFHARLASGSKQMSDGEPVAL